MDKEIVIYPNPRAYYEKQQGLISEMRVMADAKKPGSIEPGCYVVYLVAFTVALDRARWQWPRFAFYGPWRLVGGRERVNTHRSQNTAQKAHREIEHHIPPRRIAATILPGVRVETIPTRNSPMVSQSAISRSVTVIP